MFDLRTELKKVALKVQEILHKLGLIADYIVEAGITTTKYGTATTTWYYKKYNSGFVKLVGYRDTTFVTGSFKAWGSLYVAAVNGANLPFTLNDLWDSKAHIYDVNGTYTLFDGTVYTSGDKPTVDYTGGFSVIRTSAVAFSARITYEVYGLWKSISGGVLTNLISHLQRRWEAC